MNHFYPNQVSTTGLPLGSTEHSSQFDNLFSGESGGERLLAAIPQIVWSANTSGAITYLNQRWQKCTGVAATEALGFGFCNWIHPEDRDRVQVSWRQAVNKTQPWDLQFRLRKPDLSYYWVLVQALPVLGDRGVVVEWVGTFTDIDRLQQAQIQHETEGNFFKAVFTSLPEAAIACGMSGTPLLFNQAAQHFQLFLQSSPSGKQVRTEELPNFRVLFLPEQPLFRALKGEAVQEVEVVVHPQEEQQQDRKARTCAASANAIIDPQGQQLGAVMVLREVPEPKLAEDAMYFLAQASALLSASLDYKTTLENFAKLIVPYFADWCAINANEPGGICRCVAIAHAEMSKEPLVWELQQRYPVGADGIYHYLQPLRNSFRDACFEVSDEQLATIACDPEHLALLRSLNFKSYLCLPLRLGSGTFGSILFVRSEPGHLYSNSALALAEDLARRAALAIEKALLYEEAQTTGENLRQAIQVLDEQQQQLQTLQRITNLLNQRIANLQGLLQVMVDEVAGAIPDAEFCLLALHDREGNYLKLTAASGVGCLPLGQSIATEDGLLLRVFTTGKSELVRREFEHELSLDRAPAAVYGVAIESALAGRLGVLAIGNWGNANAFSGAAQRLLEAVGEQAAIAINNARLIETLEQREQLLERQNQVLAAQNRELESQRQRIQLQNLQLLEAAKIKSQFLSTVSHELRTPMNAIIGFSQLLLRQRQEQLNTQQTDMVQRILQNGKNLLVLINDILDLSKIEMGRSELELEEVDLAHLAISTALEFSPLANEKNLAISVCVYLQNRCIVNDVARLRQIFVNLLSNSIKFTEQGGIYIHIWESAFDRMAIAIRDTGIGISQADLPHIFEKFRQADQTTKRKYPGTGLGLAITSSLVAMMKGSISVESHLGEGSVFRIELPRHVSRS